MTGLSPAWPAAADEALPFRLCADPDNLPFSSTNAETPGFYIEAGQQIAHAMGRSFQPVWVPTYNTKRQIRQKLLAGRCDGFVGVPDDPSFMGPRLIFSKPIVVLGYALVAPPAMAINRPQDLHDRHVAVQYATPPQDLLATRNDVQMVTVLSPEEGLQDLASGKADAAFVWGPSAGWLNATVMHSTYRVVPVNGDRMEWSAAIAFPRNQGELRDQVDHALDSLGGTIRMLAAKYDFPVAELAPAPGQETTGAVVQADTQQPAATPTTPSPAPAAATAGPADVEAGRRLFNQNCAHCHGPDAVQGEQRRNLRLLRQRYGDQMPEMFMTTVTHGRVNKGMPNWSGIIVDDEFRKILTFLTSVQEPGS
jgi:mono/diheme cytochrome c family protein